MYVFSVIWSLCYTTDPAGREILNIFVRSILDAKLPYIEFPKNGTIYDYCYKPEENVFVPWEQPNKADIDPSLQFHDAIIPTAESNRSIHFLKLLVQNGKHALSCGPAGIGKSSYIRQFLATLGEEYSTISVTFTRQTKCSRVKEIVMSKLQKIRKNTFGPSLGKSCVLFVDDMNMPKKEAYGAQRPLELIRQCIDQKSWYDKQLNLVNLQGITVVAAMEAYGGAATVSNRLIRHFNLMTETEFGRDTMTSIFSQLLSHFHKGIGLSVRNIHSQLIEASLSVYGKVRDYFTPNSKTPHYIFNFRDVWKVFRGLGSASLQHVNWAKDALKLWYN
jgi:dynein heavy chain, axonemal